MKRTITYLAAIALIASACSGSPKFEDLTTVERGDSGSERVAEVADPDSVTIYRNVDKYRNINVMCINGDALITRSNPAEDYLVLHIPADRNNLCAE